MHAHLLLFVPPLLYAIGVAWVERGHSRKWSLLAPLIYVAVLAVLWLLVRTAPWAEVTRSGFAPAFFALCLILSTHLGVGLAHRRDRAPTLARRFLWVLLAAMLLFLLLAGATLAVMQTT